MQISSDSHLKYTCNHINLTRVVMMVLFVSHYPVKQQYHRLASVAERSMVLDWLSMFVVDGFESRWIHTFSF